jgi:sortase A
MRVKLRWMALRKHETLHWAQAALLVLGCLGLGFCAFAYFQAALFQRYEQWRLEKTLASTIERTDALHEASRPPLKSRARADGETLGRIEIPRLGLSVVLVEGVRRRDLRVAVGHIPGTAPPNEVGNLGVAGHRDTFFRELRRIRRDDVVIVRTSTGPIVYSVESISVVKPTNTDVLGASTQPVLTLITCYPFHYIGSAPERFIVRARLAANEPIAPVVSK